MKLSTKFLSIIVLLVIVLNVGCSDKSDLEEDIHNLSVRVDNLESALLHFQSSLDSGKLIQSVEQTDFGWTVFFNDGTSISSSVISSIVKDDNKDLITITIADGSVFYFKIDKSLSNNNACDISSFKLLIKDNTETLLSDITATVSDNSIDVFIPYICDVSRVKPFIELANMDSEVEEKLLLQEMDLTKRQSITVSNRNGDSKEYIIRTRVFTGLPIMRIETADRYISSDKNEYVKGTIDISKTNQFPTGFSSSIQLKGRGNATWTDYPKKPYRIKLDKKASMFNIPEDKSWVLLAGYCDKSLLRATIQFKYSEVLQLDWTPKWQYVELFLNGQYWGNYIFTEHIKTSKNRVRIEENGYLFEKDYYASLEPVYFYSDMGYGFSFKTPDPDDGIDDTQIEYVKTYIKELEEALDADDVLDEDASFLKMIDVESWAKWYLVNFLTANQDPNDYYVIASTDAKLKKGPVWDGEWSVGIGWDNLKPVEYDRDITYRYAYYPIMMRNPYFASEVKRIFLENKDHIKTEIIDYINEMYEYLYVSQQRNFDKWPIMNTVVSVNYTTNGTWDNEIQFLKSYLLKRLEWAERFLSNQQ